MQLSSQPEASLLNAVGMSFSFSCHERYWWTVVCGKTSSLCLKRFWSPLFWGLQVAWGPSIIKCLIYCSFLPNPTYKTVKTSYENQNLPMMSTRQWPRTVSFLTLVPYPDFITYNSIFRGAPDGVSLVAQMVKNLPAVQETQVQFLGWEDPLEKEMASHSSILAWRIPQREEPSGLLSVGP